VRGDGRGRGSASSLLKKCVFKMCIYTKMISNYLGLCLQLLLCEFFETEAMKEVLFLQLQHFPSVQSLQLLNGSVVGLSGDLVRRDLELLPAFFQEAGRGGVGGCVVEGSNIIPALRRIRAGCFRIV